MYFQEYLTNELRKQHTDELVQAAAKRAMLKRLRNPVLRQRLACFVGHRFVDVGKRLLAYGEVAGPRGATKTVIGQAH